MGCAVSARERRSENLRIQSRRQSCATSGSGRLRARLERDLFYAMGRVQRNRSLLLLLLLEDAPLTKLEVAPL